MTVLSHIVAYILQGYSQIIMPPTRSEHWHNLLHQQTKIREVVSPNDLNKIHPPLSHIQEGGDHHNNTLIKWRDPKGGHRQKAERESKRDREREIESEASFYSHHVPVVFVVAVVLLVLVASSAATVSWRTTNYSWKYLYCRSRQSMGRRHCH